MCCYLFSLAFLFCQVQGAASVALGYLSFDHTGERELLHMCREETSIVHIIKYYTRNYKLSSAFLEGWKHFVVIGLPGAKLVVIVFDLIDKRYNSDW